MDMVCPSHDKDLKYAVLVQFTNNIVDMYNVYLGHEKCFNGLVFAQFTKTVTEKNTDHIRPAHENVTAGKRFVAVMKRIITNSYPPPS